MIADVDDDGSGEIDFEEFKDLHIDLKLALIQLKLVMSTYFGL